MQSDDEDDDDSGDEDGARHARMLQGITGKNKGVQLFHVIGWFP